MTSLGLLAWIADVAAHATPVLILTLVARRLIGGDSAARRHTVGTAGLLAVACLLFATCLPGYVPWVAVDDLGPWLAAGASPAGGTAAYYTAEAIGKSRSLALASSPGGWPVARFLSWLWLLVAALLTVRIAAGIAAVGLLQRRRGAEAGALLVAAGACARRSGLSKAPRLVLAPGIGAPMAWGPPAPLVALPRDAEAWSDERLRLALLHEMAHIRRRDSLAATLGRVSCALLWFHPLAWCLDRGMGEDREEACDDRVLAAGGSPPRYARYLLELAAPARLALAPAWVGLPGRGGRRAVARRIRRILRPDARRELPRGKATAVLVAGAMALALALALPPAALTGEPATPPVLDRTTVRNIREPFQEEGMRELDVPGAVVALVQGGEVLLQEGFGFADLEEKRPVEAEHTVFRLGSITKVLTAISLLQLLDEKGIGYDSPVAPYARGLVVPSAGEPVTFRHLLTHTGGFDQLGYGRRAASREALLPMRRFLRDNLVAQRPPGEVSTYDTYGMTLAGHLVEAISGRGYEEYVVENVFRRLGMRHSGFQYPGGGDANLAVGYAGYGDERKPQAWEHHHTVPASSANSTAADMARLMRALLAGCQLGGVRLLAAKTCREMLRPQFRNHPRLAGYGYGFQVGERNGRLAVQHGGSMDGFAALLFLLPEEDFGLFVAGNREDARLAEGAVAGLMYHFFPGDPEPSLDPPYEGKVDVSRFTGPWVNTLRCHHCEGRTDRYWQAEPFTVEPADEKATLVVAGGAARAVAPLLFQRDDGLLVAFREDSEGRITHMFIRQTVYERPQTVAPPPKPEPTQPP